MKKETAIKYGGFVVSRAVGTGVDTLVLWICAKFLFNSYLEEYIISPMISFEVATLSNFIFSYYWIWKSRIKKRSPKLFWSHFLTFNLSCVLGFLIKMGFLLLFEKLFGWSVVICNLAALCISGIVNYFFADAWVFRKRKEATPLKHAPLLCENDIFGLSPKFQKPSMQKLTRIVFSLAGVDKMNRLYDSVADEKGAASAHEALKNIGCDYYVGNADRLDTLPEGAFITVSNHPYGGLDGLIIIDLVCEHRKDFKVMVNNVLGRIKSMKDVFITVTPSGDEKKKADATTIAGIKEVIGRLGEGHPMGFFPSGAVSNVYFKPLRIEDRPWQESLMRLIKRAKVPVIPVRFFDHNSRFYYLLGLIDWRVRLLRLPREFFNKKKGHHRVGIGETISVEEQNKYEDIKSYTEFLRSKVYNLPLPEHLVRHSIIKNKGDTAISTDRQAAAPEAAPETTP